MGSWVLTSVVCRLSKTSREVVGCRTGVERVMESQSVLKMQVECKDAKLFDAGRGMQQMQSARGKVREGAKAAMAGCKGGQGGLVDGAWCMVSDPWASRLMVKACKQRRSRHIDMPRPAGTSFSKQCGAPPSRSVLRP